MFLIKKWEFLEGVGFGISEPPWTHHQAQCRQPLPCASSSSQSEEGCSERETAASSPSQPNRTPLSPRLPAAPDPRRPPTPRGVFIRASWSQDRTTALRLRSDFPPLFFHIIITTPIVFLFCLFVLFLPLFFLFSSLFAEERHHPEWHTYRSPHIWRFLEEKVFFIIIIIFIVIIFPQEADPVDFCFHLSVAAQHLSTCAVRKKKAYFPHS